MNVSEMIEIFEKNPHNWCFYGCEKALAKLRKLPDMPIEEVVKLPNVIVPEWAYYWARDIGARDIGDKEIMIDRVIGSEWAYHWSRDIGDREIMRDRITDPKWTYRWARNISDREIMRDRITDPKWAF